METKKKVKLSALEKKFKKAVAEVSAAYSDAWDAAHRANELAREHGITVSNQNIDGICGNGEFDEKWAELSKEFISDLTSGHFEPDDWENEEGPGSWYFSTC